MFVSKARNLERCLPQTKHQYHHPPEVRSLGGLTREVVLLSPLCSKELRTVSVLTHSHH